MGSPNLYRNFLIGVLSSIIATTLLWTFKAPVLRYWRRAKLFLSRSRKGLRTSYARNYLTSFNQMVRHPVWDARIFNLAHIKLARVLLREVSADEPVIEPDELESQDLPAGSMKKWKADDLAMAMARSESENVAVLLGGPGTGKSTLLLQVVRHLASIGLERSDTPVPIYINLAGFDDRFEITQDGFKKFLLSCTGAFCPRYLKDDDIVDITTDFGEYVKKLTDDLNLLIVLDSMDEMPTSRYTDRVKTITSFVNHHLYLRFVIACRHRDFITILDPTADFRIRRFDILPWDRSTRKRNIGTLDSGIDTKGRSGGNNALWEALNIISGGQQLRIDGMWKAFTDKQLKRIPHDTSAIGRCKGELAELAYEMCVMGKETFALSAESEHIAIESGLIHKLGESRYSFAIRSLANYFAAFHLSTVFKQTKQLPIDQPDDINIREVMILFSRIMRGDAEWRNTIAQFLRDEVPLSEKAKRLLFAAECIQGELLGDPLVDAVFDTLSKIIPKEDGLSHQRSFQAISYIPEVFTEKPERVGDLFELVIKNGSDASRSWIFKTTIKNKKILRSCWKMLLPLIYRFLNERKFGTNIRICATSSFECRSVFFSFIIDSFMRAASFAMFLCSLYILYLLGLSLTLSH